jgi:hypothetical protein
MPSRADSTAIPRPISRRSAAQALAAVGIALHAVGLVGIALLLWWFLVPATTARLTVDVSASGTTDLPLTSMIQTNVDTIDVVLHGAPSASTRAMLRAVRNSGRSVRLSTDRALPSLAVSVEERWRSAGGVRIQVVGGDSLIAVRDDAGVLDSLRMDSGGAQVVSGPVQGQVFTRADRSTAAMASLRAGAPAEARVLVIGNATWESKFLIVALEEAGWPVDVAVTVSPRVTIGQGTARTPSRARHAIVVLLTGAPASAVSALPAFVRDGGGLVLVGEAARIPGLAGLRAGAPGRAMSGEPGAETSDQPRHGLDLVPVTALVPDAVVLEARDARTAIAARRVGAGRVLQVGYENSWLWRMAGDDDAPVAHRRWWSSLLAALVPMHAPTSHRALDATHDTLDAAPIAALVRDLGAPIIRAQIVSPERRDLHAVLSPQWLLATTLLSLVAAWIIRRWSGFA